MKDGRICMRSHTRCVFLRAKESCWFRCGLYWITWQQKCKQFVYFSPEDADSIFLRNVGIDLRYHTAPKPNTTSEYLKVSYNAVDVYLHT
jgi:hypothetical protein